MFKVDKLSLKAIEKLTYDDSPNFSGIVAGECKGDMWVDDLDNPNIALVYSFAADSFSILGEPSNIQIYNKFKDFLLENMFHQLKGKGIDYFEFSVESEKTKPYILDIFNNQVIQSEDEYILRKTDKYNGNNIVPDGYEIFKVDYEFLKKLESGLFENKDFLAERLLESWGTYDNFLNKSIGYVAVNQNEIVAVILGTARFKNIIPIDIETENSHRKKGLAFALACYFVNECIDNGVIAQWDCMDSNIASRKTAERVGFQFFKKNKVYWFDI
ncbi:GNAT family N-acetyltransferase [Tissierella pigra]|uniref:GNAT family N-acetyltransferase n=1 Tax=Tissierella pigra TaxID=2607614 RepID=A0A6N7XFT6_9FIRM|nr:GNAT family N-acetyltransferase [Tissierella pigra]MSU00901.1 GNAT family N-acetyltransferase [Tissierella pigra]